MTRPVGLRLLASALIGAGVLALTAAPSQAYSALYVFGDSLSDVGNVYTATGGMIPVPPYDNGRFSNGPVWAERLSSDLHLGAVIPSLLGGKDYAFGYATASDAVPESNPLIPNVQEQVASYAASAHPRADPGALYAVWIGANDVLNALSGIASGTLTFEQAFTDLATSAQAEVAALKSLVGLGAEHLLVGLVPDIGLTPRLNANSVEAGAGTALSRFYNQQLVTAADSTIAKADLTVFDPFTLLDKAVSDPSAYGFTNVTGACFGGSFTSRGSACTDPNDYLFWDSVHPTAAGHDAIADLALQAISPVPLPAAAPMFGAALVLLGAFAAVRRHAVKTAA